MVAPEKNKKIFLTGNAMNVKTKIEEILGKSLKALDIKDVDITLEHPTDMSHGDYATNVAMICAKREGKNPLKLAEEIAEEIRKNLDDDIEKVEVAGSGFINFYLSESFFSKSVSFIYYSGGDFGKNKNLENKRVMVEYTDPNPFKELHAGHLMSNSVGESISRLIEFSGAEVIRANYQGDVGPHVAKALWGMMKKEKERPPENSSLEEKISFIGSAYVEGSAAYEKEEARKEIDEINKAIYEKSNPELMKLYSWGREASLVHFEEIYKKLGTSFNHYFFESETAERGKKIVKEGLKKGVFERSEEAVIFKGEKYGLHTRVFVTSLGLPTYETKDLGLNAYKFEIESPNLSVVVTGNEQTEYFKVMLKALSLLHPEVAEKTIHIGHGMLTTPEGKMSSRKGNVMGGGTLLDDAESVALKKTKEGGKFENEEEEKKASETIALAAIRFTVLKQTPGKNVVFDFERSLSLEGDSGPYLQYSFTRAASAAKRAEDLGVKVDESGKFFLNTELERILYRFPEVVERAQKEYAPHYVVTYLTSTASSFNVFYAEHKIADPDDRSSGYKLLLTKSFQAVMKNGLYILGIGIPDKM